MNRVKLLWCVQVITVLVLSSATSSSAGNVSPTINDVNGLVGVGTVNPEGKLHVSGTPGSVYLTNTDPGGGTWRLGEEQAPGKLVIYDDTAKAYRFVITPGGTVGIGTANPGGGKLVVVPNIDAVALSLNGRSNDDVVVLDFRSNDGSIIHTRIQADPTLLRINPQGGNVSFPTGNVGIGTTAPSTRLHVAGDAQVDGNIAAKFQDVAEWTRASSSIAAGTVVVINAREANSVAPSDKPYDTRVAGVVSAKPGLLLGEAGEDKAMIALSGRVRVKVDATYRPIAVGDLLVTSPTPGHAMRSEPVNIGGAEIHRPGTLMGKALEPLAKGLGEILILLTLQ